MPSYPVSPLSRVTYAGNGATTNFTVTFPYIAQANVKVTVNAVTQAYTWVNATTIQISPAPANGATILIVRDTQLNPAVVDYVDASTLREADLDLSVKQELYLLQELLDQIKILDEETAGADVKAKVSATDTTTDYLQNKLTS